MCDCLREWQRGRICIETAFDYFEVRCDTAEVFVGGLVREVPETEGLANFAWRKKLFELSCER